MLEKIIHYSIKNKLIVILFTLTIAAFGFYAITQIPVGAVPDITNNQVQVITTSGNLSTQEIEQFITAPVELEMSNLPGVKEIRSVSKFGLSVVTIVLDENLGTYLPRQLIAEKIKIAASNIPEEFGNPEMGPITTGLGEIYQYILDVKPGYENRYSSMELRSIQDWIVKRQLSGIEGVVEINTWGGLLKQYEVAVKPDRLLSLDVTLIDVFNALKENNSISGGAYIEKSNQSFFIRGDGILKSLEEIGLIIIKNRDGIPVLIKDVAEIRLGNANRFGAITANGQGEKIMGQIMMLKNANSKKVIDNVKKRVAEVQKNLPEGIYINPILERSELIGKTSLTVAENLILGCLIVIISVIIILGNLRSALVIASMIPLALLFTISMMYIFGIDANLMSLGALDFGIIIDGAVIIVEFIAIRITTANYNYNTMGIEQRQSLIDKISFEGASKMMSSAIFGQVIILIVFIPILSLSGVEGKMFRPMAMSFSFALMGAMLFGLTWLPVAASIFLRPEKPKRKSLSNWIMNIAYRSYTPVIRWSYNHKKVIFALALLSLLLTGILFSVIGGEFVPTLDEGDFVIQPVLKTGTSLSKTIELTTRMENILKENFPEIEKTVSRIGAAEVPTDPMSMEEIDLIIKLKPKDQWINAESKEELAEKIKASLSVIPGIEYEFTQPIEMRFNELITGVRADIAIKIFGEDLDYLNSKAIEIKNLISDIPGAADIILEKTAGLPQMIVKYDRNKIARYGINISVLNNFLSMAFGGAIAGNVFEGEKRFDLVIRLQKSSRTDIEDIKNLYVPLPNGNQIMLSELAEINYAMGPAKISRENTHRRVVVSVNVRNRDLESVIKDIQRKIDASVKLQPGNYIKYGGQFENLQNATKRLKLAVPVALLLIFIFLHFAFNSFKDAALIFTAVPLSAVGGVIFLWIRGMPFSVSAGIGFIALFGVAVLNGIVLIEHLKELRNHGITDMKELIMKATKERLRPVLLTAASAALGFLPMAISSSAGAEVQRPLATVVIGGLITSTMLTMIALPLLYAVLNNVNGVRLRPPVLKKMVPVVIFFFVLNPTSNVAQNRNLAMNEAVDLALKSNKELKSYELRVNQSKAAIPVAFNIDKTNIYYSRDENNIAENGYPLDVFGVAQNFNFPSVYFSQRKINRKTVGIEEFNYEKQKLILSKNVSLSYIELIYLFNKQNLYNRIDSLYTNFDKQNEIRLKHGEISYLESLNTKAKKQQIKLQAEEIKSNIEIAYQKLNSLIQSDSLYSVGFTELTELEPMPVNIENEPGLQIMKENIFISTELAKLEKQKYLPDINIGIFNGSNKQSGSRNYTGYEFGIGIPLFFGDQKAKVKQSKIGMSIAENQFDNYTRQINNKVFELNARLIRYKKLIDDYNQNNNQLSNEILKSAEVSFRIGEINFYQYIQSIENATEIKINYLDNLYQYNSIVLELNYLTY
ncbi:MAG: CusA/CzcA family heavy metal efflux RND transporter [Bacteroidales bacterium]